MTADIISIIIRFVWTPFSIPNWSNSL